MLLKFPFLLGLFLTLFSGVVQAQPPDVPVPPSEETTRDIVGAVAAMVEATGSDEGYRTARELVSESSSDVRLRWAWRDWRRVALAGATARGEEDNAAQVSKCLTFRGAEIEELHPGREAEVAMQALVRVHLDVTTILPDQPVTQWPAEPWQGEFTLQKKAAPNARWQFVFIPPLGAPNAFIPSTERGGNRLQQAIQVACQPQAMRRTVRWRSEQKSLALVVDAVQRYVARTGHYPPARYFAALLDAEPEASRPTLRYAFGVAGTTRVWVLNPALAARTTISDSSSVPLLWDGDAARPYFSLAGHTVMAFADGHIELRSAKE